MVDYNNYTKKQCTEDLLHNWSRLCIQDEKESYQIGSIYHKTWQVVLCRNDDMLGENLSPQKKKKSQNKTKIVSKMTASAWLKLLQFLKAYTFITFKSFKKMVTIFISSIEKFHRFRILCWNRGFLPFLCFQNYMSVDSLNSELVESLEHRIRYFVIFSYRLINSEFRYIICCVLHWIWNILRR